MAPETDHRHMRLDWNHSSGVHIDTVTRLRERKEYTDKLMVNISMYDNELKICNGYSVPQSTKTDNHIDLYRGFLTRMVYLKHDI